MTATTRPTSTLATRFAAHTAGDAVLDSGAPAVDRTERVVRVALAGCGVVGGAFARLAAAEQAGLAAGAGVRVEIVRVLVRDVHRARDVPVPPERFTGDVAAFLATPADVVVEALGGLEPARRVAEGALAAGRRLVTANKTLVAAHGPALAALAAAHGTALDFEAAVGGAVPAVRVLRDGVAGVGVHAVRGILNGTCNYLLTRLECGARWDDALADAVRLGFAEPDPTLDVTGEDAAAKIRVLAWLAFGLAPAELPVATRGLVPDAEQLTAVARAAGRVCRLVAECVATEAGIVAAVEPVAVAPDGELGRVTGERNAVQVESRSAGRVVLGGPGAGGTPTAGALLADVQRAALGQASAATPGAPAGRAPAAADGRVLDWLLAIAPNGRPDGASRGPDDGAWLAGLARHVGVELTPSDDPPDAPLDATSDATPTDAPAVVPHHARGTRAAVAALLAAAAGQVIALRLER